MNSSLRGFFLLFVNLLIPISYLFFAKGFFPYKPFLSGLATYPEDLKDEIPPPVFDKVVFMLIDALRSDFVYSSSSGFEFVQSLINNGAAIPFTAHATSPTVTQPRLKAITTGSIPSFLDMVLNIDESDKSSNLANQDTWLTQMKAKGVGKQVMYGDDTWLKLFPDFFDRFDGTTSFFVSDFTIVDNNVTRHVTNELQQTDWNVWILHYLGVDHIGHKAGAASVNMIPKQREMDAIVKEIYTSMETQAHLNSTLFVLCGDHGMTDAGNHGGSAPGETSAALTFVSPKLKTLTQESKFKAPAKAHKDYDYYIKVEQSDIAPTLAGLLGFPMPQNNLGVFIPNFLSLWPPESHASMILANAMQMFNIVKETFPHPLYEDALTEMDCKDPSTTSDELACIWNDIQVARSENLPSLLLASCFRFCKTAQKHLSSTASNYNINWLLTGIASTALCVAVSLVLIIPSVKRANPGATLLLGITSIGYTAMMFASSYVEEEHQFWWWVCCGWVSVLCLGTLKSSTHTSAAHILATAVLLRIIRYWNQSGQKFAGSQDTISAVLLKQPPAAPALMLLTIYFVSWEIKYTSLESTTHFISSLLVFPSALATSAFKTNFALSDNPEAFGEYLTIFHRWFNAASYGSLVSLARYTFLSLAATAAIVTVQRLRNNSSTKSSSYIQQIHPILTLFLVTQTRLANIPLFASFVLVSKLLYKLKLDQTSITLSTLLLSYFSYFAMGGTNAISSIDLSNAYNGVADYNVVAVGVLLFVSNWSGPIFWTTAGVSLLLDNVRHTLELQSKQQSQGDAASKPVPKIVLHEPDGRKASLASINGGISSTSTLTATNTNTSSSSSGRPAQINKRDQSRLITKTYLNHISLLTFFSAISAFGVMLACHVLRTHLFVWTVFSPKFLYAVAWALGWHLVVNVLVCGGLMSIG